MKISKKQQEKKYPSKSHIDWYRENVGPTMEDLYSALGLAPSGATPSYENLRKRAEEKTILGKGNKKTRTQMKEKTIDKWLVFNTKANRKLKFNKENGDVILGEVKENFTPETNEYNVFLCLLNNPSHMAKYTTLLEKMYPGKEFKEPLKEHQVDRWALDSVMRNIKITLGILPRKKQRNKDIFQTLKKWKGYRIVCE